MGRGVARAGGRGQPNEFISQIILPAAQGPRGGGSGEGPECKTWGQASAGGDPRPGDFRLHTSPLPATVWVQVGPNRVKGRGKTVIRLCREEVVTG